MTTTATVLRRHAEQQFAEELAELRRQDGRQRPANWQLSPWAVVTYLMGGRLDNGFEVSAKYIGQRRLIEIIEEGNTFEMSGFSGSSVARVGRDVIASSLPSALMFELSKGL